MSKNASNHVKMPATKGEGASPQYETNETQDEQYHGENTKSLQDDKKVGQHNGNGRPPLMKK
jgi:hypothetical protein